MKKYNFNEFLEAAFPLKDPFLRSNYGNFHNMIKWLAIRFAYICYRFGISANLLNICCLFLTPLNAYIFYLSLYENNMILSFISYTIFIGILFADFADGMLSKVSFVRYSAGDALDNLCPDIIKYLGYLVIGVFANDTFFFILMLILSIVINTYVIPTKHLIGKDRDLILNIFYNKMSLNGFRIIFLFMLPLLIISYHSNFYMTELFARSIILIYLIITIIWIYLTLESKVKK
jgi:hypothetical protein